MHTQCRLSRRLHDGGSFSTAEVLPKFFLLVGVAVVRSSDCILYLTLKILLANWFIGGKARRHRFPCCVRIFEGGVLSVRG